jgi:hypothetical protein
MSLLPWMRLQSHNMAADRPEINRCSQISLIVVLGMAAASSN